MISRGQFAVAGTKVLSSLSSRDLSRNILSALLLRDLGDFSKHGVVPTVPSVPTT
jgi:hypothetical protein